MPFSFSSPENHALPTVASRSAVTLSSRASDYILAVLDAVGGNKLKAAETLKIGTSTLFRKLKQYQGASSVMGPVSRG